MLDIEWDDEIYLPVYQEINESDADVKCFWGGRDSGKSYDIATRLIEKCLTEKKFKCILIRKTFESIRESQWELLRSIVEDKGLTPCFSFTKSPLEVKCINGNGFIARGCDNPHNIKSVTNPTDAWYEEADKLNFSDYSIVSTSLRSNDVKVQEWISFNPESEGDFEEHWLYKMVGHNYGKTVTWAENVEVEGVEIEVEYISCHTTFNDNEYCPPERKAKNMATTEGDDYLYNVYIHGRWGNREIENPFATQYDESFHVIKTEHNSNRQLVISIDFNIDPFSANVFNVWNDGMMHVHQVDEIEISGGTIEKLADEIRMRYNRQLYTLQITGDAMGNNRTIGAKDNKSLFRRLKDKLGISEAQFKIKANPTHKASRDQVNYFLKHFPDFKIGEQCTGTRRDMRVVQVDLYGHIIKQNRKDVNQRADFLDNIRYFVNTYYGKTIEQHRKNGRW